MNRDQDLCFKTDDQDYVHAVAQSLLELIKKSMVPAGETLFTTLSMAFTTSTQWMALA